MRKGGWPEVIETDEDGPGGDGQPIGLDDHMGRANIGRP